MTFVSSSKKITDIDRMKNRFLQADEGRRRRRRVSFFSLRHLRLAILPGVYLLHKNRRASSVSPASDA